VFLIRTKRLFQIKLITKPALYTILRQFNPPSYASLHLFMIHLPSPSGTCKYQFSQPGFLTNIYNQSYFLTFKGPCIVIYYTYNKSQRDAIFLKFIFDKKIYIFRADLLSIFRRVNTVYAAIGICYASYVDCSLADSRHNYHDKYLLVRVQC
jgi:hypothetical protein